MIVPTIHSNGTSRERLVGNLTAVLVHLDAARKALKEACPNARDYNSGADFGQAVTEHVARRNRLEELVDDIDFLAGAIDRTSQAGGER